VEKNIMIRIYPAYGRECNSLEDFEKDFRAGKDFKFYNGMYFSSRDRKLMQSQGMTVLCLRGKYCVDLRTFKFFNYQPNPMDLIPL